MRDGGSTAPSRTAAIGGTRVARIAGRRLASSVTRMPDERARRSIVLRARSMRPVFGSVKPTQSKSQNSPFASTEPEEEPDDRRERPDDQRLDDDRAQDLPP